MDSSTVDKMDINQWLDMLFNRSDESKKYKEECIERTKPLVLNLYSIALVSQDTLFSYDIEYYLKNVVLTHESIKPYLPRYCTIEDPILRDTELYDAYKKMYTDLQMTTDLDMDLFLKHSTEPLKILSCLNPGVLSVLLRNEPDFCFATMCATRNLDDYKDIYQEGKKQLRFNPRQLSRYTDDELLGIQSYQIGLGLGEDSSHEQIWLYELVNRNLLNQLDISKDSWPGYSLSKVFRYVIRDPEFREKVSKQPHNQSILQWINEATFSAISSLLETLLKAHCNTFVTELVERLSMFPDHSTLYWKRPLPKVSPMDYAVYYKDGELQSLFKGRWDSLVEPWSLGLLDTRKESSDFHVEKVWSDHSGKYVTCSWNSEYDFQFKEYVEESVVNGTNLNVVAVFILEIPFIEPGGILTKCGSLPVTFGLKPETTSVKVQIVTYEKTK